MKKKFNVVFTLLLTLCSFLMIAQNKLSVARGFQDYVFGTSPETYKNLMLEIEEGNTKLYSIDQPTKIDGVELEYMRLTFTKNKLSYISIQSKNSTGSKLLQNLKKNYGEPTRVNQSKKSYEWVGDKMQLIYECSKSGSDAVVSFSARKSV